MRAGARSLKASGFNGVGVDGLAGAAGVTSGAFYSNFPNKEAMLEAVIDAGLGEPLLTETQDSTNREEGQARLIAFVEEYISTHHSMDSAEGCVMPALSADVSRAQSHVKNAYERKMSALIDRIAGLIDGQDSDRRQRAWSIVALMVGAILISRAIPEDSPARFEPVEGALATVRNLLGEIGPDTEGKSPTS